MRKNEKKGKTLKERLKWDERQKIKKTRMMEEIIKK